MRLAFQRSLSWSVTLTVSATMLGSGSANPISGTNSRSDFNSPLAKKAEASGFDLSRSDYTKSYGEYSSEFQQRPIVSPGMGLDNRPEPSTWQKFGASIAAVPKAIGDSAKSGATKVKGWMTPEMKPMAPNGAPIETSSVSKKKIGPEIYVATAAIYEKAGRYDEATDQYEKALMIAPNDLTTMLSYAHMLDRQGRLDQATQIYVAAAKAHPKEAAAQNDLGLCFARRGIPTEAIQALTKATELQPNRELYRNNLASLLVDENRSDEALAQLKAVHGEAVAHYNLGYLLQQRGRKQSAAAHFQRAAMLDPSFTAARQWGDRIAASNTNQNFTRMPVAAATPTQVASVPAPAQRAASYGIAPEPGPAPNYLRSDSPPSGTTNLGNRYGNSLPPTPEHVDSYKPSLGSDLQFLPPVE
ncbi:MAG: tetratricopeptide repeat protein [Pirellulales bacterium]|nr:tetratricopeptide repeat protein [Pirellulales bacterium]